MKKEYYILQNIANDCDWRIEKASSYKEASNLAIHLGCEVLEGPMSFSEAMERYEELEAEI